MGVDLNKVAKKLQEQKPIGVNKDGQLSPNNPNNNGMVRTSDQMTVLEPKRFG